MLHGQVYHVPANTMKYNTTRPAAFASRAPYFRERRTGTTPATPAAICARMSASYAAQSTAEPSALKGVTSAV
jgi:hypothetical protein